jgi:hypothetical protein
MTKPRGMPAIVGIQAALSIGPVIGIWLVFLKAPGPVVTIHQMIPAAMLLSMIVVITSCTPRQVLRRAAMEAHMAPTSTPTRRPMIRAPKPAPRAAYAVTPATAAEMTNWPWPPMLNRPTRNGMTTARPVRMSGAVLSRVRVSPPSTSSASLKIVW